MITPDEKREIELRLVKELCLAIDLAGAGAFIQKRFGSSDDEVDKTLAEMDEEERSEAEEKALKIAAGMGHQTIKWLQIKLETFKHHNEDQHTTELGS